MTHLRCWPAFRACCPRQTETSPVNIRQLNRLLTQTLFLPVAGLVIVAVALGWQWVQARAVLVNMYGTDQSIATLKLVQALTVNEAMGVRDYARTLKETNLQPFEFAMEPLTQDLQHLRDSLAAQHADMEPVDVLIDLHDEWSEKFATPTIKAIRAHAPISDPRLEALDRSNMGK